MNAEEAKVPDTEGDWRSIEIFLFSNGQQFSPPRKYHLDADELNWWEATLNQLAQSHYGIQQPQIYLYTIDGHQVEGPLELKDGHAYVAVQPPEEFIDAGYQKYLLKASRSWEKRQAKKRAGCCYEDCTGYPKDLDRVDSFEPLIPATKHPDWKSQDGNYETTVRPRPETGTYDPSDYGSVLSKSGTLSQPESNKVYESDPYDNKPSKHDSGTDLRRDNDNSSRASNQKPSLPRPMNTDAVQETDYHGESDNVEPWRSKIAPKTKPDLKGKEQSVLEGFHAGPERILGSMDRGFQQRNYDKTVEDYDSEESGPGSMYTHGTWSFTQKPRSSDYGSKIGQQKTRWGDNGSKDVGNVDTLSKDRPSFGENGKREIKMDTNRIESSVNEPLSTDLRNKLIELENIPDDQTFLTAEQLNTVMGNLANKENARENKMREEIPEKNYSDTKANEYIRKTIDSRERSAEARNKESDKDGYTPIRQISDLYNNGLNEYRGQPSKHRGSENEYMRKSSQQKPRNGTHENTAGEPKSPINENINERRTSELQNNGNEYKGQPTAQGVNENEYIRRLSQLKPGNGNIAEESRSLENENVSEYQKKYGRRMSESNSKGPENRSRSSEKRGSENEYIPNLSQQKPRNGKNDTKIGEPRSLDNENISEYTNMTKNKNDRRMSERESKELEYKGRPSVQKDTENEYLPKSSQQSRNESKVEEPRSSIVSEYQSEYTEKLFDRRMNELKRDDLDYGIGQADELCNECNFDMDSEYKCYIKKCTPKSSHQNPRNGSKVQEPRSSPNENISKKNSESNDRRMSALKRDGLDHKGQPEQRYNENEYIFKSSQQKLRNGMTGSKIEEPRSSLNDNISRYSEYSNAENKFDRRMSELKRDGIDHKRQASEQRGSKIENIPKSSQQKPRNGMNGKKVEEPRNSVNKNKNENNNAENKFERRVSDLKSNGNGYRGHREVSNQRGRENETAQKSNQQNKTEHKNERKISDLKTNGIGYKGIPSEQKGRENEHTRKLSLQKTRNGINGSKLGEPRNSINDNTTRLNDPERNNRVSIQKTRNGDNGSKFGENHSKGGDLRIRGGSSQDTERKNSFLKTADRRTKPITTGARTSLKDKMNPKPGLGVPPVQVDESETPFGETDIKDRLGEPNPILNDLDKITFQPAKLDNIGGNNTTIVSNITEIQQQPRKSNLSTGKSLNRYPSVHKTITHWPQNPISNVPNESEEKLVTKDNTDIPDFVSDQLEKEYSAPKYPLQLVTSPVVTPPMVEFATKNTKKASTSFIKVISNQKSLARDNIPIENMIGDKEVIIISKNLLRNPETEIASMRLDSVKHVIDDITDASNQTKTEVVTIRRSVISIPVSEGVQTYAEVCDAAEQHGQGVVAYNTTKMQWAFSNLPSLQGSTVAANEKENIISILNKGDIVNLKLNIEVINGDRSVISSQNTTRKSRSLTNIVTTEKGSQITIDDDLYEQSKSLQSLLNEETCKGSGFEGHPKVMVVQCACCDRLNNQLASDLPACCESKKYIVLLPSSPQHGEDRCNCDSMRQPQASTVLNDAKRMSSGIPIKKTHSDMALETAAAKKDPGKLIAVINSTSQTEDTKSECLVTKHKVSITEDSLKCEFKKDSVSQMSMANHSTCHAPTSAQTDDPLGSKMSRGVLKQCPQLCPPAGAQVLIVQNCTLDQSPKCPRMSQNCSPPVQVVCCPQTCPQSQSQSVPDTSQQSAGLGCPQRCPQTQNQTPQQEQPCQTCNPAQTQAPKQEKCQPCPAAQTQAPKQEKCQPCPAAQTQAPKQEMCQTCNPAQTAPIQEMCQTCKQTQDEGSQPEAATTQQGPQKVCPPTCPMQTNTEADSPDQVTARVCMQVQSQAGQHDVSHTETQTQWCCVMLEARLQEDGRYSFHLPPLEVLKQYSF
ncbi:uncharacterized protein LOC118262901 [Spodoptera frugiperda]|uniref:Uncharacterized protein LOC118262901 n=1 Tax=Spodoptera frugiperda TaxID=7108 RepID=A0A9R0CVA1_SPOFR|nr:uncharacterized protein LOC118262901 [Spodoptera frugiperda]